MEKAVERGLDWAGLPVIPAVARVLSAPRDGPPATDPGRRGSWSRGVPGAVGLLPLIPGGSEVGVQTPRVGGREDAAPTR